MAARDGGRRGEPEGPFLHPGRRLERRRAAPGPRPRRRAEAAPAGPGATPTPPRPDARNDLPEAVDPDARLLRGRHLPAWWDRPPPLRRRPPARPRRDDQGHRYGPLALPRCDHDSQLRAGG